MVREGSPVRVRKRASPEPPAPRWFPARKAGPRRSSSDFRGNQAGTDPLPCAPDRLLSLESRGVLELVDDVAVRAEGQLRAVAELAGDVDHAAALVQQQRAERVPQGVRRRVRDA